MKDLGRYDFTHGERMGGFGQAIDSSKGGCWYRVEDVSAANPDEAMALSNTPRSLIKLAPSAEGGTDYVVRSPDGDTLIGSGGTSRAYVMPDQSRCVRLQAGTGKIVLGLIGVGLVGMFWMTASGRGLGSSDGDVDEAAAIALYEQDLAIAHCKYDKTNRAKKFRANERAWEKWLPYTTAKKLTRAGSRFAMKLEHGYISCRRVLREG